MNASRGLLAFGAVVLAVYAVSFLANPALLGELVHLELQGPNAYTEIFAFYGGLEIGMAAYLGWSAARPERVPGGLAFSAFSFGAAGLCRAIACFVWGFEDPAHPIVAGVEIAFAAAAAALYRRL